MTREADLAYWINERELMRVRHGTQVMAFGYSDDPVMGQTRYCNVRREEDKVTKWVAKHWRNPHADDPLLTLGMVTARMINWPPTLLRIGFPTDNFTGWAESAKKQIRNYEGKSWTAAYTISTCGRAMLKEDYVFDHVLAAVAGSSWNFGGLSLEDGYQSLRTVDGLGSFLAAQVIADLKNTPGHALERADDWWSWSAPGPGSIRGLQAFFGGLWRNRPITASLYPHAIKECADLTFPLLAKYVGQLHMQDFQNCLCEFSKYIRMKEGDGRARNSYTPGRRADYHV